MPLRLSSTCWSLVRSVIRGPISGLVSVRLYCRPAPRAAAASMYIAEERGSIYSPDYRLYFSEYCHNTFNLTNRRSPRQADRVWRASEPTAGVPIVLGMGSLCLEPCAKWIPTWHLNRSDSWPTVSRGMCVTEKVVPYNSFKWLNITAWIIPYRY